MLKRLNERLRGARTYIVALLLTSIGVIEQTPWADVIPEPYKRYALVAVPVVFAVLRFVTTTPAAGRALNRVDHPESFGPR